MILLILTIPFCFASNQSYDFTIKSILPDQCYTGKEYTRLFRVENLDYTEGVIANITGYYNISKKDFFKEETFDKTVKKYSYANTGDIFFEKAGYYLVCGKIIRNTLEDNYTENNRICKNISVIDSNSVVCNVSINISIENRIYESQEKIKFKNLLNNNTFPFVIEYWIEDLHGRVLKKSVNTSNLNQKSYTPKITESDKVLVINNRLAFIGCNNTANRTTSNKRFIVIKHQESESEIKIEKINKKIIKFGELLKVKLFIYKGDTTKKAIKAWLEKDNKKASEQITFYAEYKYSESELYLPVSTKPNCDHKLENGSYTLIVEGLGERDKEKVRLEGIKKGVCPKNKVVEKNCPPIPECEQKDTSQQQIPSCNCSIEQESRDVEHENPQNMVNASLITSNIIYESKNEKVKKYLSYLIMFILLLVIIIKIKRC